jgi:glycine C-acetyltransferase
MTPAYLAHLQKTLGEIEVAGLTKRERLIATPQSAHIAVAGGQHVLNFCANNYLGLADHPEIIAAAHAALDRWGYGLASVRFICGTQEIHRELESKLSAFLGTADTILYPSAFDANGGLFETLLSAEDAIISDELNHASIIDGIRLSKAKRFRYRHNDMADLESQLRAAQAAAKKKAAQAKKDAKDPVLSAKPGADMKKGGAVKKYAKGGSVSSASSRADGCAIRGKTKGTISKMKSGGMYGGNGAC